MKQYESDSDGEGVPESGIGTDGGGCIPASISLPMRRLSLALDR